MGEYSILVPLDGSSLAEQALAYLAPLRSLGESRVILLSVVDERADSLSVDREDNLLSGYLRDVSASFQEELGAEIETKVVRGVPALRILEEADTLNPDLILISTHGLSGVSRWRRGSVADKVIRSTKTTTLVIGPAASIRLSELKARILPDFKSILLPLDGSALAEQAIPVATSWAQSFGSGIHLVRVVPAPIMPHGFTEPNYVERLMDTLLSAAQTYLTEVVKEFPGEIVVAKEVFVGPPVERIEDYIARADIDLVMMTTHGQGGFLRAALGSVTDRLIGGSAPVAIVRPS